MDLKEIAQEIEFLSSEINSGQAADIVKAVRESLDSESFHLAVLGEFKRGKSSLVNSLLSRDLLPSDVLPATATINVIEFATEEQCQVVWSNGQSEIWPLTKQSLDRLSVAGNVNAQDVEHCLIQINSPFLQDGMIIIDTPGVNDLSQSRVEITQKILPFCDAALFLLDSTAAVTRSEVDFLVTKVLPNKLDSLLFILAKADRLNEDELADSLNGAKSRLTQELCVEPKIIPYSSLEVLRAEEQRKKDNYKPQLIEHIGQLRQEASIQQKNRNIQRLKLALAMLFADLKTITAIYEQSEEKVREYQQSIIDNEIDQETKFRRLLASSEVVGRQTLLKMVEKSLNNFRTDLEEDLVSQLNLFEGNMEKFFERFIPVQLEKAIKQFAISKEEEIRIYFDKFIEHLSNEYQNNFEVLFVATINMGSIELPRWRAEIEKKRSPMADGLRNSVLSMSAGAIIGYALMPHIGLIIGSMAGQVAGATSQIKRSEQLRTHYLEQLPALLDRVFATYNKELIDGLNERFDHIIDSVSSYHTQQKDSLSRQILARLKLPEPDQTANLEQLSLWTQKLNDIEKVLSV